MRPVSNSKRQMEFNFYTASTWTSSTCTRSPNSTAKQLHFGAVVAADSNCRQLLEESCPKNVPGYPRLLILFVRLPLVPRPRPLPTLGNTFDG